MNICHYSRSVASLVRIQLSVRDESKSNVYGRRNAYGKRHAPNVVKINPKFSGKPVIFIFHEQ
jgi:hypothetical protein